MKKYLKYIVYVIVVVVLYFIGIFYTQETRKYSIYGTYVDNFNTISVNKDNTYQYSYPVTEGDYKQLGENLYVITLDDLKDNLLVFNKDKLKIIDIYDDSDIKEFEKLSHIQSIIEEQ